MLLSPGQILDNRYRVVKLLGQGGFGTVYRVWDTRMERPMALKENLDTSSEAQRQFKREAQILFDLSHPNLPRVIDHFVIQGQGQYLVMEFIEGDDLQKMLQRIGGPLPEAQVLEWIGQVCDALEYLHSQNPSIIHRDIKPANIKITPEGKAMLVDFGIAKIYDPKLSTTIGARAITPGYSPQEQYGSGTTDVRSDVYALAATLYHLLTGEQPMESIQRNYDDALQPPGNINPTISPKVEEAVLIAMEPNPNKRFKTVVELKTALKYTPISSVSLKSSNSMVSQLIPSQNYQQIAMSASNQKPASSKSGRVSVEYIAISVAALILLCVFAFFIWAALM